MHPHISIISKGFVHNNVSLPGPVTPTVNYGIVIDAGSSSSKVYLFQWPTHDGDPTKLLKIEPLTDEFDDSLSKKVEPGK